MVKHVVCFKFKDNSYDAVKKHREVILNMNGKVPSLVSVEVGIDFLHSQRSYDLVLISQHETKEKLDEYQVDPLHMNVKEYLAKVAEGSISVDFEEE